MFNQGLEGKKKRKTTMDKSGSGFRPFHTLIPGIGLGFGFRTASLSHFAMNDCKIELDQFLGVTAYGILSMRHPLLCSIKNKLKIYLWG